MPLINCPECDRQISTAAEACPQCGHPNRPIVETKSSGPKCYSCSASATTRCHRCGKLSCASHLKNIYVNHNNGGGYELRCDECYSWAMTGKMIGFVMFIVIVVIFLSVISQSW